MPRKGSVSRVCRVCGRGFLTAPSQAASAAYCQWSCRYGPHITLTCAHCGDTFTLPPNVAKHRKFCKTACAQAARIRTADVRFWEKVDKNGPTLRPDLGSCWCWTGAKDHHGYGRFVFEGRGRQAHAVAYILDTGHEPPADTPEMTHLCDGGTIGCVRPSHLLPDTKAGNMRQAAERGRMASGDRNGARRYPERMRRGEALAHSRLTDILVLEIRTRYAAGGISQHALAREYGVTVMTINHVVRRLSWTHI